jgi:hypothetical protein
MPSRTKAEREKHYREYQGTPKVMKERAQMNAARALMKEKHGAAALKGKDVHHKRAIRHGGSNDPSNLAIVSVAKNRGWETKKKKR